LQQAMMVRRFFVDEKTQNTVLGSSGTNPLR
jgi:hypothetical protein